MMRGHRVSQARRAGGVVALSAVALAGLAVGTPAITVVAQESPRLAQVASAAAATVPLAFVPEQPAPAAAPRPRKPSRAPAAAKAPRRETPPQLNAVKIELAAAPALELPAPAQTRGEARIIRVAREEVRTQGPGFATAQVFVVRSESAARPHPAEEIARAIKAARASGTHIAGTGDIVQRLRIRLNPHAQGE
jgi:hypothetical protein